MPTLNDAQTLHLRRLGHRIKPLIQIGAAGLTDPVLAAIDEALTDHELVKVRLGSGDREQRAERLQRIVSATGAAEVQAVGHVVLLFRRSPVERKRRIALP